MAVVDTEITADELRKAHHLAYQISATIHSAKNQNKKTLDMNGDSYERKYLENTLHLILNTYNITDPFYEELHKELFDTDIKTIDRRTYIRNYMKDYRRFGKRFKVGQRYWGIPDRKRGRKPKHEDKHNHVN